MFQNFGSVLLILFLIYYNVYRKKSFLRKESDTLRSYRVYISPTMKASSALRSL